MYEYSALVTDVYDGDTITVDLDLGFGVVMHGQKFRLLGIDAPEVRGPERPEGLKSALWLRYKIINRRVTLVTVKNRKGADSKGKFGRWLASVYLPGDNTSLSVNEQLIVRNLAERREY